MPQSLGMAYILGVQGPRVTNGIRRMRWRSWCRRMGLCGGIGWWAESTRVSWGLGAGCRTQLEGRLRSGCLRVWGWRTSWECRVRGSQTAYGECAGVHGVGVWDCVGGSDGGRRALASAGDSARDAALSLKDGFVQDASEFGDGVHPGSAGSEGHKRHTENALAFMVSAYGIVWGDRMRGGEHPRQPGTPR